MLCVRSGCRHNYVFHEGDESGMGEPEPCMAPGCDCPGFVRQATDQQLKDTRTREARAEQDSLLDPNLPLQEFIGQAVGAASMCWESPERAGVFDSARAQRIVEETMRRISEALR